MRVWYSRATLQKLVRKGVNNQVQKPYTSQGYRCGGEAARLSAAVVTPIVDRLALTALLRDRHPSLRPEASAEAPRP